jgi:hypothetical protein
MSAAAAEIQPVATLEKERLALADGSDSFKGSDELELEHAGQAPVKRSWFRGTLFQTMVIGVCSFLSPGLWNAVNRSVSRFVYLWLYSRADAPPCACPIQHWRRRGSGTVSRVRTALRPALSPILTHRYLPKDTSSTPATRLCLEGCGYFVHSEAPFLTRLALSGHSLSAAVRPAHLPAFGRGPQPLIACFWPPSPSPQSATCPTPSACTSTRRKASSGSSCSVPRSAASAPASSGRPKEL